VRPAHIQLLFVDGLGLPPEPLAASVYRGLPALEQLLSPPACVPLDARLGVPGIPQSATGQTAIFTGINAAQRLGRHSEGFPGAELRALIEAGNVFSRLQQAGRRCAFANAYARQPGTDLPFLYRSVTTVMTLHALGVTRNRAELLAGQAVYHDVTRHTLAALGVHDVPPVSEAVAAQHLLAIARSVDFCLFEYFLTDHAGHRGSEPERRGVLATLDRLLAAFMAAMCPATELLLLVSDHGNIEAPDRRQHSLNPVPWAAYGCASTAALAGMTSLLDVTPKILSLAGVRQDSE
jgi:2,3-bisphosphoglycerate-independent phosphoglycerate mutase